MEPLLLPMCFLPLLIIKIAALNGTLHYKILITYFLLVSGGEDATAAD